ncbi:uncharacterized protein LOC122394634 [Amphibalanus amphitrite]|uniref:uncharacterized protein LOC122394634 n=1 Tax=Amphibalanus amphitrite TaxID=1232801 RepID=UPI001C90B940|nr:uncharacterized protein LOC122394634 [Amphibalanus amphitrite]
MSLATFYGQYGLSVGTPSDFGTSQWQDPAAVSWWYVAFSCVSALYLNVEIGVKLLIPVEYGGWWDGAHHASHFFIYLTNWTQLLVAANSTAAATLALEHALRVGRGRLLDGTILPLRYRLSWLLHNISAALIFTVSIAFWPSVFFAEESGPNSINYFTVSSHGGNGLYLLLLLAVHRVPRRPLHVWQPALVAAIYLIFTITYTELGGLTERDNTAFYPVLDWRRQPVATGLFAFDLVIAVPVSFFMVVGLAVVREEIWERVDRGRRRKEEEGEVVRYEVCP